VSWTVDRLATNETFFFLIFLKHSSELLKLFKTNEIINWRSLIAHFENDLKTSTTLLTTFEALTAESGLKRLEDFKARIVEHVS
jgi:hypothetical protein